MQFLSLLSVDESGHLGRRTCLLHEQRYTKAELINQFRRRKSRAVVRLFEKLEEYALADRADNLTLRHQGTTRLILRPPERPLRPFEE